MEGAFESKTKRASELWDKVARKLRIIFKGFPFETSGEQCASKYAAVKNQYKASLLFVRARSCTSPPAIKRAGV